MPTGRIMIVEDESLVAEDLQSCLARSGYEVVGIADTFDDAKHLAEQERPDLALLDIRLKGPRDGIELASELRARNIGFVYLTSHGDEGTLARAETTEPLGYVLKPFGAREMVPVLRTALYRHAADVRLRGLEQWLQTTLRSIGDAVVVTDADGRVTYLNPVAEQLLQCSLRQASGQPASVVMPMLDEHGALVPCVALRAMDTAAIVHVDPGAELVRADGSRVPIDDSAAPVRDAAGTITGAVVVMRDATQRRLLEQQRREAERRMQEAEKLQSLGVLAGGLAHDLNNILTAILGGVALGRDEAAGRAGSAFAQIEANTRAAADLCRRMLAGFGTGPVAAEPVPVLATVRELLARERAIAGPRIVFVEEPEHGDEHVLADPLQWRQVLANLLRNAIEAFAGREGSIAVRWGAITLPSTFLAAASHARDLPPGDYVWLEVADDGPGMPPDVRARVFEPFFTTKFTGRGLGLAGVHGIVRRHGGSVDLASETGLGTCFRLFWPAATAVGIGDRAAAAKAADALVEIGDPAPRPGTVLVVDDDELVRQVTSRVLRQRGWTCHEAGRGEIALQMLAGGLAVDAVVLDLRMPGGAGEDVLADLRRLRPELPVLLVSGFAGNETELVRGPHTDFLAKPFTADELLAHLQALRRTVR